MVDGWIMPSNMFKLMVLSLKVNILIKLLMENAKILVEAGKLNHGLMLLKDLPLNYKQLLSNNLQQLLSMLKPGNSIVVVSSIIAEPAQIMVSYQLVMKITNIGLLKILGELVGEKMVILDLNGVIHVLLLMLLAILLLEKKRINENNFNTLFILQDLKIY